MDVDYGGFSIREYTRKIRNVEVRKCWPFSGEVTGDFIQSFLPPITVAKFRWWSHELASLLTKSPVAVNDSDSPFRRKAKVKSKPCKKRSIIDICATAPKIQLDDREDEGNDSDVLIGSKRKRTKDHVVQKNVKSKKSKDSGDRNFANKEVNKCIEQAREKVDDGKSSLVIKERSGVMYLSSNKVGSVSNDHASEFQIPAILKAKRKVCFVASPDKSKKLDVPWCEVHASFPGQSASQLKKHIASLELCCLEMNRLSLSSTKDQSPVIDDKQTKVMSNDQISAVMHFESRQQNMFQPANSETQLTHSRAESDLSCVPGPHFSSQERIKEALDLERKGHVAQPIQSFISATSESPYRPCSSFSQPASADMHCGTFPYQSPFDPFLVEWMQKSVLYRQRHVEESIMGFPLNLQGELVEANGESCRSFDRSGLGTGSSKDASKENALLLGNLVDSSSGKKHSSEPTFAKDGAGILPAPNEKRHNYFPARLGIDETFSEKALFISDTNDGECSDTVHSSVSEANPRSNTINLSQQNGLNRNLNIRNVVSSRDGLCLQNTQGTMRLMGKDVSVGTSYSDMVRTGERIIAPDASIDYSFLGSHIHQSWLWRRTTLGVSETHTTTTLDKNWNNTLHHNTPKDPFPLFCEPLGSLASQSRTIPNSEFPPTILNPCCSLTSFPWSDKDLSFHGSGLGQPNSLTFSQQQQTFPSYYNNADIRLLDDATKPYFGLCTDSTLRSQPPLPQASAETSCYGLSFMNPAENLVSFYGSKSSAYLNVGTTNKRLASVEEYPMKNHKIPKLPMQGGLSSAKELFFAGQQIRKSPI
ncbi:hypothetical protein V5N11_036264 [Cardamine amara subsp. amara]|uniref:Uncharacterized protein n=1 Tax=Cardamine amara subsp. amara TaxID=228776 RepID=A0ABD0Z507_CARAN